MYTNVVW